MRVIPMAIFAAALAVAGPAALAAAANTEIATMQHAEGTFDVKLTPVPPADGAVEGAPGRMTIAKTFHGGIEGTSAGEMLATLKGQDGAYVALERVSATLAGRSGTFALVHRGIVDHGQQELLITVVPGSGTGGLEGIEGVFKLVITDGVHHYDLAYSLPAAKP